MKYIDPFKQPLIVLGLVYFDSKHAPEVLHNTSSLHIMNQSQKFAKFCLLIVTKFQCFPSQIDWCSVHSGK